MQRDVMVSQNDNGHNGNGQTPNENGNGHAHSNGKGAKRGPKPKIGEKERIEAIAIISAGGSLNDAADVIGIARDTINVALREDPKFRRGIDRAAAKGKLRLIKKVGIAKPWQAAAWMLERKFGAEFGKKVDVSHEGGMKVEVIYRPPASANGNGRIAEHAHDTN